MKRNIFILSVVLCILAIFTLILFAEEVKYDFRKTNWGMSKEQVKATEDKEPAFEENTMFFYEVKIGGCDFVCAYHFLKDKLYSGVYARTFREKGTEQHLYIFEYEKLKKLLIKKYGEPIIEWKKEIVWDSDLGKYYLKDWENSIVEGDLFGFRASWETPTTKIVLELGVKNSQMFLNIFYNSKELEEWVKQIKEKETLKEF